eukprot:jgi/Ulvmu1/3036/UM015_0076.1
MSQEIYADADKQAKVGDKMACSASKPARLISNMPYGVPAASVQHWLDKAGLSYESVEIIRKGLQGRQQAAGIAIVTFASETDAQSMESAVHGIEMNGRRVCVTDTSVGVLGEGE